MKKLVVLGAGYASLAFLKKLPKKIFNYLEVILISKESYHYTSVLLHEVAAGSREDICYEIHRILPREIRVICDEVVEIKKEKIVGKSAEYGYDYLVVGLGFSVDDFGIQGVREHTHSLVDFRGAVRLRDEIFREFEALLKQKEKLNIVVCGAGFSGVEMMASLSEELALRTKQRGIAKKKITLTCIEAMPHILPMFSQALAQKAANVLESMNVELMLSSKILRIESDRILVEKDGKTISISSDLSIWTAGVKGNEVIENSSFFTSTRSRVCVDAYLQPIHPSENMENIYVIGDCAALSDEENPTRFYPPTAQMSIKMGEYLAKVFESRIYGGSIDGFRYHSSGIVCSLGRHNAIGKVGKKEVTQTPAILLKRLIERKWLLKLFGFSGLFKD